MNVNFTDILSAEIKISYPAVNGLNFKYHIKVLFILNLIQEQVRDVVGHVVKLVTGKFFVIHDFYLFLIIVLIIIFIYNSINN